MSFKIIFFLWNFFYRKQKKPQKSEEEIKVERMMKEDKITKFTTKDEEDEHERLKRKIYGEKAYREEKKFEKQVERNLVGIELEKKEKIEEAIKLYESNVKEGFKGSHPYNRLAIIYRKRGQLDEEIRVLERAVLIFKDDSSKLEKFKRRLERAKSLKSE